MDSKRIAIAAEELDRTIHVGPLIDIVLTYARYTEAELTFIALMESEDPGIFDIGSTDIYTDDFRLLREHMYIRKTLPAQVDGDVYPQSDWFLNSACKFTVKFAIYPSYETDVAIDDLVPSRGLKIEMESDYDEEVLRTCRGQYLSRMSELIRHI